MDSPQASPYDGPPDDAIRGEIRQSGFRRVSHGLFLPLRNGLSTEVEFQRDLAGLAARPAADGRVHPSHRRPAAGLAAPTRPGTGPDVRRRRGRSPEATPSGSDLLATGPAGESGRCGNPDRAARGDPAPGIPRPGHPRRHGHGRLGPASGPHRPEAHGRGPRVASTGRGNTSARLAVVARPRRTRGPRPSSGCSTRSSTSRWSLRRCCATTTVGSSGALTSWSWARRSSTSTTAHTISPGDSSPSICAGAGAWARRRTSAGGSPSTT